MSNTRLPTPFAFTLSPERVSSARWANFVFAWHATTTAPHQPVGFPKPTGSPTTAQGEVGYATPNSYRCTAGDDFFVSIVGANEVMKLSP